MDSKVLIVIVVVAAVGGWLIVRAMTPAPPPRQIARQAVPQHPPAVPQGKVTAQDRALPASGGAGGAPSERSEHDFDHDMVALAAALNEDQMIESYVFRNPARHLTMPPTLRYRLMGRFWQGVTTGVTR
jgi:hypothetical protein